MKANIEENKIIFLTIDFPPIIGGISRYLYELIRNLTITHFKVIGLNSTNSKRFDSSQKFQIFRINLPLGWKYFTQQLKFLAPLYFFKLLKTKKVKIIICGQAHYSIMFPAWLYSKLRRCNFGVVAHGLDLLHPQNQLYTNFFNFLLKACHIVIVNSETTAKIAIELGINAKKIHVLHPSISLLENHEEDKVSKAASPLPSISIPNKKIILTVARLIERKGHDTVIKALPNILNQVPNAHYIIVGTGPQEMKLKQLAKNLSLESHISFVGYVPDKELPSYYEACDVFSMISREIPSKGDIEGFGIVYLEANKYGKPVVAGNSGGVEDAVIHNRTGLLIEPDNPDAAAEAISRLLIDSELAIELGLQGQQRVRNEFNSFTSAQKLQSILDEYI